MLLIDFGKAYHLFRVIQFLCSLVRLPATVKIVLQVVDFSMYGGVVTGMGYLVHILEVVRALVVGQQSQCCKHFLIHTFPTQIIYRQIRVLDNKQNQRASATVQKIRKFALL